VAAQQRNAAREHQKGADAIPIQQRARPRAQAPTRGIGPIRKHLATVAAQSPAPNRATAWHDARGRQPPPIHPTIQIPLNAHGLPQDSANRSPTQDETLACKPICQHEAVYKVGPAPRRQRPARFGGVAWWWIGRRRCWCDRNGGTLCEGRPWGGLDVLAGNSPGFIAY
jgi:hypothetical protein